MILLDTNVLGRITDSSDPLCAISRNAVHRLSREGTHLVIVPQSLFEFWAVATRRRGLPPQGQNGLGMTTVQAGQWLDFFVRRFTLLLDQPNLLTEWRSLVSAYAIKGIKAHDARLVAAMRTYGIHHVMTFNVADFKPYPDIQFVNPATF